MLHEGKIKAKKVSIKESNAPKLRSFDGVAERISQAQISFRAGLTATAVPFRDFESWRDYANRVIDPDKARGVLYYGFQPLYDALLENRFPSESSRKVGLDVLDKIVGVSKRFLLSYYTGRPDVSEIQEMAVDLKEPVGELRDVRYITKFRNVDSNGIFPDTILNFVRRFLKEAKEGRLVVPDYVVGCACGSSEIALLISQMVQSGVGFIRKSKRRGDQNPRVIEEQREQIRRGVEGKDVLCIEDYICTQGSLRRVMEACNEFNPRILQGAAVRNSHEGGNLRTLLDSEVLSLFEL